MFDLQEKISLDRRAYAENLNSKDPEESGQTFAGMFMNLGAANNPPWSQYMLMKRLLWRDNRVP